MNEASCYFATWRTASDIANQRVRSGSKKTLSMIQNSPSAFMLPGMAETRVVALGSNGGGAPPHDSTAPPLNLTMDLPPYRAGPPLP